MADFLQLGEFASAKGLDDPQTLAPNKLECYCKFVQDKVETIPVSGNNNEGSKFKSTAESIKDARNSADLWQNQNGIKSSEYLK